MHDMLFSKLLIESKSRSECSYNYMIPYLDKLIHSVKILENIASEDYLEAFKQQTLSKGYYLLKEGEVSHHIWFLEKGIGRLFTIRNDIEVTGDFFFPCEIVDSYRSSALGLPSNVNIQLIQDSVVYSLNWDLISELKLKYPVLWEIEKILVACHAGWIEERVYYLRYTTAKERYLDLFKKQPLLVKEIPLTYIASFLGITLETLSRIRASVKI